MEDLTIENLKQLKEDLKTMYDLQENKRFNLNVVNIHINTIIKNIERNNNIYKNLLELYEEETNNFLIQ